MARTEGTLVRQPQSGAGLRDGAGAVWQVIWPTDYTARDESGRIAVYDGEGNLLAHEGDVVEIADLFVRRRGELRRAEGFPPHEERFERAGYDLSALLAPGVP